MAEGIVGAVPVALELAEELSHLPVRDGPSSPAGQSNRFSAEEEEEEGERGEWEGRGKEEGGEEEGIYSCP